MNQANMMGSRCTRQRKKLEGGLRGVCLQAGCDVEAVGVEQQAAVDAHKHEHVVQADAEDDEGGQELDDGQRAAGRCRIQAVRHGERCQQLHEDPNVSFSINSVSENDKSGQQ